MINLEKDTIKKIKDIDVKADKILEESEKKAESLISQTRQKMPFIIKQAQEERDRERLERIELAKRLVEDENKKIVESGISKVRHQEENIKKRIEAASEIVIEMFIKNIEAKGRV